MKRHSDGEDAAYNRKHKSPERVLKSESNADYSTDQDVDARVIPRNFDYEKYPGLIWSGDTYSDEDDCKNIARHLGRIRKI